MQTPHSFSPLSFLRGEITSLSLPSNDLSHWKKTGGASYPSVTVQRCLPVMELCFFWGGVGGLGLMKQNQLTLDIIVPHHPPEVGARQLKVRERLKLHY